MYAPPYGIALTRSLCLFFFFQAEDGIRDWSVTGVQTCALPISGSIGAGRRRAASPTRNGSSGMLRGMKGPPNPPRDPPGKGSELPLAKLKTYALSERPSLVSREGFAKAEVPPRGAVAALLQTLPDVLGAKTLRRLARAMLDAKAARAPVLWGIGAHVLKVGLSPLLADLLERGFV